MRVEVVEKPVEKVVERVRVELWPIQCGREESRGRFEQAQRAGEFCVLLLQLLKFDGLLGGRTRTAIVDWAPMCHLMESLGHRVAECVGDRPNRHPLQAMAPVHRGDPTRLLEARRPVDRARFRQRLRELLRMRVGPRHLANCGLCAKARGDRLPLVQPLAKFGFLLAKPGFPLGELGFLLFELSFLLAKLGFPLGELGFPPAKLSLLLGELGLLVRDPSFVLRNLGFPLGNLGFPMAKLRYLLGKRRGSPLGELGFPPSEVGFLLAELAFMLAHFAFALMEGGFPLSKLGVPLLKHPILIAKLGVPTAELGGLLGVSIQLLLNQVDEEIDFLLAVTTLADARRGERDVMNIGRSESHRLLLES